MRLLTTKSAKNLIKDNKKQNKNNNLEYDL